MINTLGRLGPLTGRGLLSKALAMCFCRVPDQWGCSGAGLLRTEEWVQKWVSEEHELFNTRPILSPPTWNM